MSWTDFIPGVAAAKWIVGGLVVASIAGGAIYAKSKYDASIRKPLEREITFLTDSIEANKKRAAELLATETAKVREAEKARDDAITYLEGKYHADTKKRDADYAALRLAHGQLLDKDAAGCWPGSSGSPAVKAGIAGGTPETSGGNPLSARLEGLLWAAMKGIEDTIAQYEFCQAYAIKVSK